MSAPIQNLKSKLQRHRFNPVQFVSVAAILIPIAYLSGRFATGYFGSTFAGFITATTAATALGALLGIPVGLFFGGLRSKSTLPVARLYHAGTIAQQDKILEQIREELTQNRALFEARQGNPNFLTRIAYLTDFWTAVKASGQLFVMQEPKLLHTIATAYYWIEQANRLENLAYESKYEPAVVIDNQNATTHLIAEARLLDGPLGSALTSAVDAINVQLAADTPAPTSDSGEPAASAPLEAPTPPESADTPDPAA